MPRWSVRGILLGREDSADAAARAALEGAGLERATGKLRVPGGRWAVHGLGVHPALRERTKQAQGSGRAGNFY